MLKVAKDNLHADVDEQGARAGSDHDHEQAREALPLPEVPEPSPSEVARRNLTYRTFNKVVPLVSHGATRQQAA